MVLVMVGPLLAAKHFGKAVFAVQVDVYPVFDSLPGSETPWQGLP